MMTKRTCVLLTVVLVLAGCASSANDEDPNAPQITMHIEQVDSGVNNFMYPGQVNVQFILTATNTTKDAVTLNRVQVQTISSGAYSIAPYTTNLNLPLAPGQTLQTTLSVWGYARGGRLYSEEPVTLRGTAYMKGPSGAFVKLFTEYISQR